MCGEENAFSSMLFKDFLKGLQGALPYLIERLALWWPDEMWFFEPLTVQGGRGLSNFAVEMLLPVAVIDVDESLKGVHGETELLCKRFGRFNGALEGARVDCCDGLTDKPPCKRCSLFASPFIEGKVNSSAKALSLRRGTDIPDRLAVANQQNPGRLLFLLGTDFRFLIRMLALRHRFP